MEKQKLINKFENENFVKELTENRDGTKGNFLSIFDSNFRNLNSFVTKLTTLVSAIEQAGKSEWKQNKGQPKYKEHRALFAEKMGMFNVDSKTNVFSFTETGKLYWEMVSNLNQQELFINDCVNAQDSKNEVATLKSRINNTIFPFTIDWLINRIENEKVKDLDVELTYISLIKDDDFYEYFAEFGFVAAKEFVSILKRKGILEKYLNTQISKKTIIDSLKLLKLHETTLIKRDAKQRIKRFTENKTKTIIRDSLEVAKVLKRSNEICEICGDNSKQFKTKNESWYSNVHHIVPLGTLISEEDIDKYDKSKFMINLCPFHHMEVHHSIDREIFSRILDKAKSWGLTENIEDKCK